MGETQWKTTKNLPKHLLNQLRRLNLRLTGPLHNGSYQNLPENFFGSFLFRFRLFFRLLFQLFDCINKIIKFLKRSRFFVINILEENISKIKISEPKTPPLHPKELEELAAKHAPSISHGTRSFSRTIRRLEDSFPFPPLPDS